MDCLYVYNVLIVLNLFTDKQLAYEAKEQIRLRLEGQEESLRRDEMKPKTEKLDIMSLESRSSF